MLRASCGRDAVHDAGVWRLPEGEAYYDWGIRSNTTTAMTGEEIHRIGLEQVAALQAELDRLLKAQGYTQGTVGDRLNAMNEEARFLYPNTDAGRAELLATLNRQVEEITPLLPRVFNTHPERAARDQAGAGRRSRPARRAAIIRAPRSTARGPAPITSTCATPTSGRASACRR